MYRKVTMFILFLCFVFLPVEKVYAQENIENEIIENFSFSTQINTFSVPEVLFFDEETYLNYMDNLFSFQSFNLLSSEFAVYTMHPDNELSSENENTEQNVIPITTNEETTTEVVVDVIPKGSVLEEKNSVSENTVLISEELKETYINNFVKDTKSTENNKEDEITNLSISESLIKQFIQRDDTQKNSKTTSSNEIKKETNKQKYSTNGTVELVDWFKEGVDIFYHGKDFSIIDVDTGIKFNARVTCGSNHADWEPITEEDVAKYKEIYSGKWSWERRAVIVLIDGRRIAGSVAGMPHAGVDGKPYAVYVDNRSGEYGYGQNLDAIENGISGHFDLHLYNSKTHGTNSVRKEHQDMVMKAYNSQK